jgi:ATP-dependent Zn protease
MGVAHFAPADDHNLHSRSYLEAQIIKGLGGRVAEELAFGSDNITGGAESDLVQVNRIARHMVYRLGMGGNAGLLVYDPESPLSASTQALMDDEVRALLDRLHVRTTEVLRTHRTALDALAEALLDRETIDGAEVLRLVAAHGVPVTAPLTAA